ncbi:MAG TPA: deoxynucleoside kinase [Anaerolineales bacterium]|jgi:deoxyadenosine/deoxycytidine kinase|nr:deoxynucleoside kinase [Anaerolineales bacterium]
MAKRLVLVAGNIGSGKTSLTKRLGERLGWLSSYESVADNPYLADFYADMSAWAFHLQVFFLGHRAEQHLDLARSPQSAIADRSIYEDMHIFARASFELGNVTERDFTTYRRMYEMIVRNLPQPDLLLYLTAPVEILLRRIRERGREMESGVTPEYLSLLDRFYGEWIDTFDLCPVLKIHSGDLDFVHQTPHLDVVIDRMNEMMAGKEDIIFADEG